MTSIATVVLKMDVTSNFKALGTTYWQKLVREGVPRDDAKEIATAIAKLELFAKPPSSEQKQLISEFSRFVCRAQLWRSDLLI